MEKVKNIYYTTDKDIIGTMGTGIVLELEDGKFLKGATTDVVVPYSSIEDKKTLAYIKSITGPTTKK